MLTQTLYDVVRYRVDPRPLGAFRALFGCLVLLRGAYLIEQVRVADVTGVFAVGGAHVDVAPGVVIAWGLLGVALAVGWQARWAAGLLAALILLLLLADPAFYHNHLYLMGLVAGLLACADCGAALALDARDREPGQFVPGWPVLLLKAQTSIVYGFAALAKLHPDFLSGLSLHVHLTKGPFAHLVPQWFTGSFPLLVTTAVVVVAIQSLLAWGLWVDRVRGTAVALGVLLHAPMVLLANSMHQAVRLVIFSFLMWGLYLLFAPVASSRSPTGPGNRRGAPRPYSSPLLRRESPERQRGDSLMCRGWRSRQRPPWSADAMICQKSAVGSSAGTCAGPGNGPGSLSPSARGHRILRSHIVGLPDADFAGGSAV